jgi:S-formylglutathione hydrolase FrmB
MGGYGAIRLGEVHPGLFGALAASSPALYTRWQDVMAGAFDDEAQYEREDVFAGSDKLEPAEVWIGCGHQDPFVHADEAFAERLGPDVTTHFGRGYHDAAFWRSICGAQVRFLASKL